MARCTNLQGVRMLEPRQMEDAPISTSVKLGEVSGVELVSIFEVDFLGFPVAQHFNSAGHSITDVQVRDMRLCRDSKILRKQLDMRLIFQLQTVQPDGLNINFKYV